jgi:hypothetical protein
MQFTQRMGKDSSIALVRLGLVSVETLSAQIVIATLAQLDQ